MMHKTRTFEKTPEEIKKALKIEGDRKRYLDNQYEVRKAKICWTYSDKFWRNDVDFIDGKCYYKGKEVEIRYLVWT